MRLNKTTPSSISTVSRISLMLQTPTETFKQTPQFKQRLLHSNPTNEVQNTNKKKRKNGSIWSEKWSFLYTSFSFLLLFWNFPELIVSYMEFLSRASMAVFSATVCTTVVFLIFDSIKRICPFLWVAAALKQYLLWFLCTYQILRYQI